MSQKIPCPHCSAPDWQNVTVEGEDRQTYAHFSGAGILWFFAASELI
jgi:hypothetical protein